MVVSITLRQGDQVENFGISPPSDATYCTCYRWVDSVRLLLELQENENLKTNCMD